MLKSAETEVRLAGRCSAQATEVDDRAATSRLNGMSLAFGGYMVRRAAAATIEEALDGLERIGG